MKFMTEIQQNGTQHKFQGVQKSKWLSDFSMSKTDITGSNYISATCLHIPQAVNTLNIKTLKKGNQMDLPIWVRRTRKHETDISTQYFYLIDILEEISDFLSTISKKQAQPNLMQSPYIIRIHPGDTRGKPKLN